ncbi:hypothetical protein CFE70_004435 [Pyrenophora teres f. teres 0-1]|uniref:DUF8021 domain-containing protein n=2 Tax=Pyrenophora teres f. teres TaxID=97479 RepID=E3S2U8_PYRTT|nr:hypothetical protein PTT_16698 [Pyrenophora teres f. teres 0-1]KAE8822205.1 hypothetical protein HRS9122_10542 [Pyrenophora teres f. teres]KAE8840855.1 hypothetical protein PTNB85_04254 [Pyrenophora teres f. teres]KAE8849009.1 hypothetical protein HRS9122_03025 [Pyrenophora teres f. teres]KAE8864351.1 hypothetical protein PTNB29_04315 [Pyrenophora teres f. teres]
MPLAIFLRATFIAAALTVGTPAAACTREGLIKAANSYLSAQAAGNPGSLSLANTNFTYSQNNKVSNIANSLLSTASSIDLNRTTADTLECASYTMWISTSGSKPRVVSTQIRHSDNDTATISSIDTVAATTGDLFFDAAKTLSFIRAETWTPFPSSSQPSRALLKSFGDAYLDMWTDSAAAGKISWGMQCERVEGSRLTKPCGVDLPRGGSKKINGMRRYVIDEPVGSVQVSCQFDGLGAWPDSHEIRVEDGKVKYVHTVTVMRGVGA